MTGVMRVTAKAVGDLRVDVGTKMGVGGRIPCRLQVIVGYNLNN